MKTILAVPFVALVLFAAPARAQTSEADTSIVFAYAELVGVQKFLSTQLVVSIDIGQRRTMFTNNTIIDPATGKTISFNSMVDAMNYMGESGWEFVQAYVATAGNQNTYRWLLKRACRRGESGDYVPLTRAEYLRQQRALAGKQ